MLSFTRCRFQEYSRIGEARGWAMLLRQQRESENKMVPACERVSTMSKRSVRGPWVRWAASGCQICRATSRCDIALLLKEVMTLRQPPPRWRRMGTGRRGEERRGEERRGARRQWVQIDRKYARFITYFQSACQPPMISSANEGAFQDHISDFDGPT
jgi:hypothetical protein